MSDLETHFFGRSQNDVLILNKDYCLHFATRIGDRHPPTLGIGRHLQYIQRFTSRHRYLEQKKGRHHFFVTDDTWIQIFIIHTMKRNIGIWPLPQFGYANSHRDFQCKVWIFGGLLLNSPFHCKTDYD